MTKQIKRISIKLREIILKIQFKMIPIIAKLYSRIGKPRFYDFTIFMIRRAIRSLRANASGTVLTFIIPFYVAISTKVYLSGYRTERTFFTFSIES